MLSDKKTTPDLAQRSIVGCTAMAGFVYQFESNLVNVALPTIGAQLRLTTFYASLIPIAFLIGAVTMLVPSRALGSRFGLKRVFVLSVVCMTLGTVICGMAANFSVLFCGRLIQGIGAGGMAALGYAIIPAFLPSSLIGYGFGRLSVAAGLGMIAGNPAGGMLSQFLPWRCVFLVTVPLMLALIVFSLRNLPKDNRTAGDIPEKSTLADSLIFGFIASCAIIFLSYGAKFGFTSTPILGVLFVSAVLAVLLVTRERRGGISFLPKAMIGDRMFLASILGIVVERCAMGGILFLMPFYLTTMCALSPALISLLMLSYAVGFVVCAPFSGAMADNGRAGRALFASSLIGVCACALFCFYSSSAHWSYALIFLIVTGSADGLYTPSANKTAVASIPAIWKQHAAVFLPLAVSVGIALGVSFFETVFTLPFPKGESILNGARNSGITMITLVKGFQLAFLVGVVLWGGILFRVIFIRERKEATGHVETSR